MCMPLVPQPITGVTQPTVHTLDAVARGRVNNSVWPLRRIPMRCFSTEGLANKLVSNELIEKARVKWAGGAF